MAKSEYTINFDTQYYNKCAQIILHNKSIHEITNDIIFVYSKQCIPLLQKALLLESNREALIHPKIIALDSLTEYVADLQFEPLTDFYHIYNKFTCIYQIYKTNSTNLNPITQLHAANNTIYFFNSLLKYLEPEEIHHRISQQTNRTLSTQNITTLLPNLPNAQVQFTLQQLLKTTKHNHNNGYLYFIKPLESNLLVDTLQKYISNVKNAVTIKPQLKPNINNCDLQVISLQHTYLIADAVYNIIKQTNEHNICIIADDSTLAHKIYHQLCHNGIKKGSIHFQEAQNLSTCHEVQFYITLAKLLFADFSVEQFLHALYSSLNKFAPSKLDFLTQKFHGIKFRSTHYPDLCKELDPKEQHKCLHAFSKQLQKIQNKILYTSQLTFSAKVTLLDQALLEIINEANLDNLALYSLQETLHNIHITEPIENDIFIAMLQFVAQNTIAKNSVAAQPSIFIKKSTDLYENQYDTLIIANLNTNSNTQLNPFIPHKYRTHHINQITNAITSHKKAYLLLSNNDEEMQIYANIVTPHCKCTYFKTQNTTLLSRETYTPENCFTLPNTFVPQKIYATAIQRLMRNPAEYFIYDILKIRPIEEFNSIAYRKQVGIIIHKCIELSTTQKYNDLQELQTRLATYFLNLAQDIFTEQEITYYCTHVLNTIAKNVYTYVANNSNNTNEIQFCKTIKVQEKQFEICAIIDRIEYDDTQCTIIDYKTGALPSTNSVLTGLNPQLLIALFTTAEHRNIYSKYTLQYLKVNASKNALKAISLNTINYEIADQIATVLHQYFIKKIPFNNLEI